MVRPTEITELEEGVQRLCHGRKHTTRTGAQLPRDTEDELENHMATQKVTVLAGASPGITAYACDDKACMGEIKAALQKMAQPGFTWRGNPTRMAVA